MGWFWKSSAPKKAPAPERPPPKAAPSVFETHRYRGDEALVIMKSYEWSTGKLALAFFPREPSETVRQYLSRLDGRPGIDAPSLWEYADSFEQARYSDHPIGPAEKGKAVLSMRAALGGVMKSLDGTGQAAAVLESARPGAGQPAARYRFVAPPVVHGTVLANGSGPGDAPKAAPPMNGEEELRRAWGAKNNPPGARIPEETVSEMKEALARRDPVRLGGLLLEQGDGPAAGWRAFLDSSLAGYLLEFDDQALVAGGARPGRLNAGSSERWQFGCGADKPGTRSAAS